MSNLSPRPRARLSIERLEDRTVPAMFDPQRVLVTFADSGPRPEHLTALQSAPGVAAVSQLGFGVYRVDLDPGSNVAYATTSLVRTPGVSAVEPDRLVTPAVTPNDPSYASQWSLTSSALAAPAAWSITTGTGRTIVAVIDTGVDTTHPDLAANLWRNPREIADNGRDDDRNGFVDDIHGANFAANSGNPADDVGHGTHVAGIIGAVGNNRLGVSGVAWRTRIMALKFMGRDGGFTSDAVRAVDYAVANGARIINASWGGGGFDSALSAAIRRAQSAGVIVVTAAGNAASDNDRTTFYPASYVSTLANIVAVAATDSRDQLAAFSNFGRSTVTLGAPGVGVLSTMPGGGYAIKSGTSMAAPFASGALSLLWDQHPTWSWQQVIAKLQASVDLVPALAGRTSTGGRLDLARLLDVPPPPPPPPTPPTGDRTGPRVIEAVVGGPRIGTFDRAWIAFSEPVDSTSLRGAIALQLPGGGISAVSNVLPVAGTNNTQFTVVFDRSQTAAGLYTLTVSYLLRDAVGNRLDQNQNGVNGELTDWFVRRTILTSSIQPAESASRLTVAATGMPHSVADKRTTRLEIPVNRDLPVKDLVVHLKLTHTRTSDLSIRLTAPDGRRVMLFNRRGGIDLSQAVFADAGPIRPEQPLTSLNGLNARGLWVVEVFDLVEGVSGTLSSVELTFEVPNRMAVQTTGTSALLRLAPDVLVTAEPRRIELLEVVTSSPGRGQKTEPLVEVLGHPVPTPMSSSCFEPSSGFGMDDWLRDFEPIQV